MQDKPFIEFRNVEYSYSGRSDKALRDISFSLQEGQRVLILGSNGSGKSTVTRLMTGLLSPDKGSIHTAFLDTSRRENLQTIRRKAGLLFQNPTSQIVATVVREDTAFGPENLALSSREIRERVEKALKQTSLHPLRRRATHNLSAGQQQRLALAGVLALGSGCLILDEAASMLNPLGRREMDDLLDHLHDKGFTIIRVSHFMDQVVSADRILVLKRGELVFSGTREEFLVRSSSLQDWSLVLPAVPALSEDIRQDLPDFPLFLKEESFASYLKDTGFIFNPESSIQVKPVKQEDLLLSLKAVNFEYNRKSSHPVQGLSDVDLDYFRGETLVLMGDTGSGKSTLLQVLNSLLVPSSGYVSLLGENPLDHNCDLPLLRRRIGLVMQQPEKQLFAPLAGDDVAFGPRLAGLEGRELALRVREAMELVGLPYREFRDRPVRALSGGQKRKVSLAGILAMKPEILLLDEPTAGLDPLASEELEQLLVSLRTRGIGLIVSTHDVELALRIGSRLIVMDEGRKAFDGTPEDFFREHIPGDFGLEYPLALRIWRKIRSGVLDPFPLKPEQLKKHILSAAGVSPL